MSAHLLLVSLGPVQDFIATARRCQDLWFGSYLLGELALAAAGGIEDVSGGDSLIFPAALGNEKKSMANKVLALLREGVSPAEAARAGQEAMEDCLQAMASQVFDPLKDDPYVHLDVANAQLMDLMEYQWVSVAISSSEGYGPARELAEQMLAARKNTRTWGPVPWDQGDRVPKSSLDGARESVLDEGLYDAIQRGRIGAEHARRRYGIGAAERLCGVGLLKRLGCEQALEESATPPNAPGRGRSSGRPAFHSSSHMAAAPWLTRLTRLGPAGTEAFAEYLTTLEALGVQTDRFRIRTGDATLARLQDPLAEQGAPGDDPCEVPRTFAQHGNHGLDGCLLFEGRLGELVEEYRNGPAARGARALDDAKALEEARRALHRFCKKVGAPAGPVPYYVLLQADGDRMGRTISRLGADGGIARHRQLAMALEAFALKSRALVEQHAGSLIYSGGDDVLALLPLHTALQCASALRTSFLDALAGLLEGLDAQHRPTLSIGLAVAHHLEAMDEVRSLAAAAERLAKRERDSLAILVSKRSGGTVERSARWSEGLAERLLGWSKLLRDEQLPDGIAFELEEITRPFALDGELAAQAGTADGAALLALARRAIGRKRQQGGTRQLETQLVARLLQQFGLEPRPGQPNPPLALNEALTKVLGLSTELQIARLLLEGWQAAWGPLSDAEHGANA